MRLALQILRKDIERLWWAILLSLAMLILWMFQDATPIPFDWRGQPSQGTWLNMALPFLWSVLIALAIHQDPLVGDRQFWAALPCGWRSLLAAKAMFIAAFIQAPYFVATAVILSMRGFNPLEYLPHLFWKQLVLLAFIVPAVAVATTVKNMAQFLLVLITVASALILFSTRLNLNRMAETWDVRWALAASVLSVGGLLVVILQFVRRSTIRARALGIVTAAVAASLYSWLPRDVSAAVDAAFSPVKKDRTPVSLQLAQREPEFSLQQRYYNFQRTTVLIPLDITGVPPAGGGYYIGPRIAAATSQARLDQISLELIRPNGERYAAQWLDSTNGVKQNRIEARLENSWQVLEFYAPAVWNRINSGRVTVQGRVLARFYQPGSVTELKPGEETFKPKLGHCSNRTGDESAAVLRKVSSVACESPSPSWPLFMFEQRYGGPSYYPEDPWLSPLRRGVYPVAGTQNMTFSITSQTQVDTVLVDYTIPDIDLSRYVVHTPVKPEAPR